MFSEHEKLKNKRRRFFLPRPFWFAFHPVFPLFVSQYLSSSNFVAANEVQRTHSPVTPLEEYCRLKSITA